MLKKGERLGKEARVGSLFRVGMWKKNFTLINSIHFANVVTSYHVQANLRKEMFCASMFKFLTDVSIPEVSLGSF
jgi:hypothetical protein